MYNGHVCVHVCVCVNECMCVLVHCECIGVLVHCECIGVLVHCECIGVLCMRVLVCFSISKPWQQTTSWTMH